jgi:PAS domain-containing protein
MRELARLRTQASKLRTRPGVSEDQTIQLLDQSLDVTEQLRAEAAALQERCGRLEHELDQRATSVRILFDVLPIAVVTTDATGVIVEANRAASALLGRSSAKLQNHLLLHFAEDRIGFGAIVRELPIATGTLHARMRFRPQERAPFDAELTVIPDTREDAGNWLWFLERQDQPRVARVHGSMPRRVAG